MGDATADNFSGAKSGRSGADPRTPGDPLRRFMADLDRLPAPPRSVGRILAVLSRESSALDLRELIALVGADAAATATVFAEARYIARSRPQSLREAVDHLGLQNLKAALFGLAVRDLLGAAKAGDPVLDELWKHALLAACMGQAAAEMIADPALAPDPDQAFAAGLFHDCGRVALVKLFGTLPADSNGLADPGDPEGLDAERDRFGLDHASAGAILVDRFGLPEFLHDAALLHHHPPELLAGLAPLVGLTALADQLAHAERLDVFLDPNVAPGLAARFGFTPADLEEIRKMGRERFTLRAGLFQIDGEEVPFLVGAVENARRLLARTQGELVRQRNELVAAQSLLDALAKASPALQAAQSVDQALALGRTLAKSAPEFSFELTLLDEDAAGPVVPPRGRVFTAKIEGGRTALSVAPIAPGPAQTLLDRSDGLFSQALERVVDALAAACSRIVQAEERRRRDDILLAQSRELAKVKESVAKAERLAAVGVLAAGAAHEINNPLAILYARLQLLAQRETDPARRAGFDQMTAQIERITGILSGLMDFARPRTPVLRPTSPREIVKTVLELCREDLDREGVAVVLDFGQEPAADAAEPLALADAAMLEQVLLNLVVNARHALESKGGTITLSVRAAPELGLVRIRVADDGKGVSETDLKRVFDPFFTTKTDGRGVGLGLSVCEAIMRSMKGAIRMTSCEGRGTSVDLVLPALCGQTGAEVSHRLPVKPETGPKVVLVVDDEAEIRALLEEALGAPGRRVLCAPDAETALELVAENDFDLALVDHRLPGLSGLELLGELKRRFPDKPVLMVTGLAGGEEIAAAGDAGALKTIPKPFNLAALVRDVGELLQ